MVWALHFVQKGTETPDPDFAFDVVGRCVEKGLMLFAPVGFCGATIKVNPPLTITEDAVVEGCGVLREAIGECAGR